MNGWDCGLVSPPTGLVLFPKFTQGSRTWARLFRASGAGFLRPLRQGMCDSYSSQQSRATDFTGTQRVGRQ